MRRRFAGHKTKEDCMELIRSEVASLLEAYGENARVQLEKQKYERSQRHRIDTKVRSYYETDDTVSVFISHFAQQIMIMKGMINVVEAEEMGRRVGSCGISAGQSQPVRRSYSEQIPSQQSSQSGS